MRKVVFLAVLVAALPALSAMAASSADEHMANWIGNQLKQSGKLHNYKINVEFHDGTAYLEGTVTSVEQRTIAVRLAEHVKGVKQVQYKLVIPGQEDEKPSNSNGDGRYQLTAALDSAAQADAQKDSHVVHAYQQPMEPMMERQPMMQSNMGNGMWMQRSNMPRPAGPMGGVCQAAGACPCNGGTPAMGSGMGGDMGGAPMGFVPQGSGRGPSYDNANMPAYAWPSYASYPNYAALTYPKQYSPTAWPYIGPFYPYPQVPLAWRKVSLEWDDGWWFLDFSSHNSNH